MTTLDRWVGRVLLLFALVYFLMVVCSPQAKADEVGIVTPDGQLVTGIDPEFAATYYSVMQQEHGFQCEDDHTINLSGHTYHILGAMQILWDGSTAPVAEALGLTYEAVATDCLANLTLAQALWLQTYSWRRWQAQPQYRTEGGDDGSGF